MPVTIRPARPDDLESLLEMQRRSMRLLGTGTYAPEVLESALVHMGTMDPRLIADGTYLVAEVDGRLAGSAGWTMRAPNYASLLEEVPSPLPGRIGTVRSVYVEPMLARCGVARSLMSAVEAALADEGAEQAELMATLCGVPLYQALGYVPLSDHPLLFADGVRFVVRRMVRPVRHLRVAA